MKMISVITRATRLLAVTIGCHIHVRAAHNVAHMVTSTYDPIPDHLSLTNVVIIHRHGDRSQISREIGPNFPETSDVKDIWNSKLPLDTTMLSMASAAYVPREILLKGAKSAIFTGWDEKNIPYGQLTELGANQLMNIGKELRRRYVGTLLPDRTLDASTMLYCRSTHFCRTIQSLRSLLSGLLETDDREFAGRSLLSQPIILSRAKSDETMFPGADGPCPAMSDRRTELFANNLMEKSIPDYLQLEQKMRDVLGYTDRVNWLPIKEILTCYEAHGIAFPEGITDSDADRVTDLAGWMWGTLYQDDTLNRLAIGRFLREMLDVLHPAVHNLNTPAPSSSFQFLPSFVEPSLLRDGPKEHAKMMIYSGHDSTLVPVLCALGIYDGVWPPYASYLSIEVAESTTDSSVKYVRAIYNDKEMIITGCENVWCPYDIFHGRLESLAITHDQYIASGVCAADGHAVDEDIKATIGEK